MRLLRDRSRIRGVEIAFEFTDLMLHYPWAIISEWYEAGKEAGRFCTNQQAALLKPMAK